MPTRTGERKGNPQATAEPPPRRHGPAPRARRKPGRAAAAAGQVLYTGTQHQTSPWSPSLRHVEWAQPVSLWGADCSLPGCCAACSTAANDNCADTVTRGLFYASASTLSPDPRVVLAQDITLTKPTGPRSGTQRGSAQSVRPSPGAGRRVAFPTRPTPDTRTQLETASFPRRETRL